MILIVVEYLSISINFVGVCFSAPFQQSVTELQQSITKANQSIEKAQNDYDNMLAKVSNLEAEYTKYYNEEKNQNASFVEIDQYLKTTLKVDYENLARKEDVMEELLKQQTILLQREQSIGIASLIIP